MDDRQFDRWTRLFSAPEPLSRRGLGALTAGSLAALGLSGQAAAKKKKKRKKKRTLPPQPPPGPPPDSYRFVLAWGDEDEVGNVHDVAVDADGNVYIVDPGIFFGESDGRIRKYDNDGNFVTQWGGNGEFDNPQGIALDGDIAYIVDAGDDEDGDNQRVQKWKQSDDDPLVYEFVTSWSLDLAEFDRPQKVAVDSDGNVYVADTDNHRILKFTSDGTPLPTIGSEGAGPGQFRFPLAIAIDADDNLHVSDSDLFEDSHDRIQKLTTTGGFIRQWGSGGSGNGQFDEPLGIAFDSAGNVFVADQFNDRVQKFTSDGDFLTAFGEFGEGQGQFRFTRGVAVDGAGNVFVADSSNFRVQKWEPVGAARVAGEAVPPGSSSKREHRRRRRRRQRR